MFDGMTVNDPTTERVREILKQHGRLSVDIATLSDESDLYLAGMTSHASVNLMLALEDQFEVEFPERMLRRKSFESVAAMRSCVQELLAAKT